MRSDGAGGSAPRRRRDNEPRLNLDEGVGFPAGLLWLVAVWVIVWVAAVVALIGSAG